MAHQGIWGPMGPVVNETTRQDKQQNKTAKKTLILGKTQYLSKKKLLLTKLN